MFLIQLKEENKELFLKVCIHASMANGIFEDEEKEMISAYCREMNIPVNMPEYGETLDETLSVLAEQADDVEKKIIILEILGLVRADGVYDAAEKTFMKQLVEGLNIKEDILSKYNSLLEIYTSVCKELRAAVCE